MGSEENCASAEVQVEGRNGEENSDMGGEKAGEVEGKEEGIIEGKEKKSGDLEGAASKKPNKRGRKMQATVSSKRGKKEIVEEGNVEAKSSDFVAEKEEESGENLDENGVQLKGKQMVTFVENLEIANGEDGASIKEGVDSDAAGNGHGNSEDVSKRRLRAVPKKVSYDEVQEHEDEGFMAKKRGRKGRQKRKVVESEGQDGYNDNGDSKEHAKKRGRRGRPRKQASESEGNEGKDVKQEDGTLGMTKSEDLLRPSRVPKEEEEGPVPDSKKRKDFRWIPKEERLTCHQCKRNDKGRVVRCKLCNRKRYCIPCLTNWYSF